MNINILGDNCSHSKGTIQGDGWDTLISKLTNSGANLYFNDLSLKTYDLLIAFDHYKWMEEILKNVSVPIKKRILIMQEPEVVLPRMYKTSIINLYGHIYAGSIDWAEKIKAIPFDYPLDVSSNSYSDISHRSIEATMIQSNKFSCITGEQYSLRRSVLKLAKELDYPINLYGAGWNRGYLTDFANVSKYLKAIRNDVNIQNFSNPYKFLGHVYPNYWGIIENKFGVLHDTKKNIVIENSSTYVSEKLFDSLRGGCVPFYVGPNLSKYGIPESIVIRCEANPKSILKSLSTTNLEMLEQVAAEGEKFKNTTLYKKWDASASVNKLLDNIFSI